jgi:type VI secretion system protein ImpF
MPDPNDDHILPCLFDRLVDENPGSKNDTRGERAISLKRYRDGVLRDVAWLLNAKAHLETDDIHLFGEASRSVLNFGIPDFCGRLASGLDLAQVEHRIVEALKQFEQRMIPNTLSVRAVDTAGTSSPSVIAFEIRGELWATPVPEQLYIKTQIDLETGQCVL